MVPLESRQMAGLVAVGGLRTLLSAEDCLAQLQAVLERLAPSRVLLVPPDFTRYHSGVGSLTVGCAQWLRENGAKADVLPALGTHKPLSREQIEVMFTGLEADEILVHDWRHDLARLGVLPAEVVRQVTGGRLEFELPVDVNRRLVDGDYDLILSLGQVVPHEVIGMANQSKNILVGLGGAEIINRSHYVGAVCGMEAIMGRPDSPVRQLFRLALERFGAMLPICYALTVRQDTPRGVVTRGLYVGSDEGTYRAAANLSAQVNLDLLDEPLSKVVVWLDPDEFHSTWLGNKAIYRTRMALADGAELVILAPGLRMFGEDAEVDRLIRTYGYRGTPATLAAVERQPELQANLSAAAHLIHGSSEGRFDITYATCHLSQAEVAGVGYRWTELGEAMQRYQPAGRSTGWHTTAGGERFYFIANPALGLWALRNAFGAAG